MNETVNAPTPGSHLHPSLSTFAVIPSSLCPVHSRNIAKDTRRRDENIDPERSRPNDRTMFIFELYRALTSMVLVVRYFDNILCVYLFIYLDTFIYLFFTIMHYHNIHTSRSGSVYKGDIAHTITVYYSHARSGCIINFSQQGG